MYPIAPNGIFRSLQGEGILVGTPMTFIRLAGCSIGCQECDTDYSVNRRLSIADLVKEVVNRSPRNDWVWITGGEPCDHDINELILSLQGVGFKVAVATSGIKPFTTKPDFLSVSPHCIERLEVFGGDELKVVIGLNGIDFDSLVRSSVFSRTNYKSYFVCPLYGDNESLRRCIEIAENDSLWKVGFQAHKQWRVQ